MLYNAPGDNAAIPFGSNHFVIQCWGAGGGGKDGMAGGGGGHVREEITIDISSPLYGFTQLYYEVGTGGENGEDGATTRIGVVGYGDLIIAHPGKGGNNGGQGGGAWSRTGLGLTHMGGNGYPNGGGGGVGRAIVDGNNGTATDGGTPCGGGPGYVGSSPGGGGGSGGATSREGGGGQCSIEFL